MNTDSGPGVSQPTWDDLPSDHLPAAGPPTGPPTGRQRRRIRWRTVRSWVILFVALAVAVVIGVRQAEQRLDRADQVQLGNVALVADPVDVSVTHVASVVELLVKPRQEVSAGDPVAVVNTVRPAPAGGERQVRETLVAPIDGVVGTVPTNVGAALQPGGIVVRLYDPKALAFQVDLDLVTASRVDVGMTGVLTSDATGSVTVDVVSIESSLDDRPGDSGPAEVRLEPQHPADVADLLPGLVFTGYIDESGKA
jgi:hypothetical protein